jgi:hypothetical protein
MNEAHKVLVTGNSFIKKDGSLVMGRGAAKQLASLYPNLPYQLGTKISAFTKNGVYGVILVDDLGVFQVKYHFKDNARRDLITKSSEQLCFLANILPEETIFLNYPGIGNGRLNKNVVSPILEMLPDNVHVWTFGGTKIEPF